jgi:hypothetical protein
MQDILIRPAALTQYFLKLFRFIVNILHTGMRRI